MFIKMMDITINEEIIVNSDQITYIEKNRVNNIISLACGNQVVVSWDAGKQLLELLAKGTDFRSVLGS